MRLQQAPVARLLLQHHLRALAAAPLQAFAMLLAANECLDVVMKLQAMTQVMASGTLQLEAAAARCSFYQAAARCFFCQAAARWSSFQAAAPHTPAPMPAVPAAAAAAAAARAPGATTTVAALKTAGCIA